MENKKNNNSHMDDIFDFDRDVTPCGENNDFYGDLDSFSFERNAAKNTVFDEENSSGELLFSNGIFGDEKDTNKDIIVSEHIETDKSQPDEIDRVSDSDYLFIDDPIEQEPTKASKSSNRSSAIMPVLERNRRNSEKKTNYEFSEDVSDDFDDFDDDSVFFDDDVADMSDELVLENASVESIDETVDQEELPNEPGTLNDKKEMISSDRDTVEGVTENTVAPVDVLSVDTFADEDSEIEVPQLEISEESSTDEIGEELNNEADEIIVDTDMPKHETDDISSEEIVVEAVDSAQTDSIDDVTDDKTVIAKTSDSEPVYENSKSVSKGKSDIAKRAAERKKKRKKRKKREKMVKDVVRETVSWVAIVLAAFLVAFLVNLYIARPSIISGSSMEPTLHDGDTVIISKIPYILGEVKYGDIVVIDRNTERERTFGVEVKESLKYNALTQSLFDENDFDEDVFWIKRVVGVAGDVIEFKNGLFIRNGEVIKEDYILSQNVTTYIDGMSVCVEEGCVFVMGDNRDGSLDSRFITEQIKVEHIVGKLISK